MAGELQPLDQQFQIVDATGRPTLYFIQWAQQRQIDIGTAITLGALEDYLAEHMFSAAVGSGIELTPDGNLANSPAITAKAQEILDQISAVRGTVLYRGAGGWTALAPGAAGKVLQTNGPGADPTWVAPASGSSDLIAFAFSDTAVTLPSNVTILGGLITDLTVAFNLAASTTVQLQFSMLTHRTSGSIRILTIVDGAVLAQPSINANFYTLPQNENAVFQVNGTFVFTLAAGAHTVELHYSDALSVDTTDFWQRMMTVRKLA